MNNKDFELLKNFNILNIENYLGDEFYPYDGALATFRFGINSYEWKNVSDDKSNSINCKFTKQFCFVETSDKKVSTKIETEKVYDFNQLEKVSKVYKRVLNSAFWWLDNPLNWIFNKVDFELKDNFVNITIKENQYGKKWFYLYMIDNNNNLLDLEFTLMGRGKLKLCEINYNYKKIYERNCF